VASSVSDSSPVLASPASDEVWERLPPPEPLPEPGSGPQFLTGPTEVPSATPAADLSLAGALAQTLEANPDLLVQRQGEPVGRAVVGVARTYPFNPILQVQVLPFGQNNTGGSTAVSHYVLLWQTLELAHQRRYRESGATADLTRTRWTIHQAELTSVAQTERLYATAVYQRQTRDVLNQVARLNEELVGVLERRFEAAQALGADVSLARMQARASRQQAELAEANYQTALLDLSRQLAWPPAVPLAPNENLTGWRWTALAHLLAEQPGPPAVDRLDDLIAGRPDVMAARADLASSRAALGLAKAGKIPNLTIGPYYQRDDTGTTGIGFRAWSDVPVVNTGEPLVRQRLAELHARQQALDQAQIRAKLEARAALNRYERGRRIVERTGPGYLAELEADVARIDNQYNAGQVDLLHVYAARTAYVQGFRAYLDTLNELAQAAANVTATTGLPPAVVVPGDGR
jgi:outer membrane protein, heavy metal efflux system